jgi:hypothetical protein
LACRSRAGGPDPVIDSKKEDKCRNAPLLRSFA